MAASVRVCLGADGLNIDLMLEYLCVVLLCCFFRAGFLLLLMQGYIFVFGLTHKKERKKKDR